MQSYGFAPLRLPADLDFTALFHGVDERVPVKRSSSGRGVRPVPRRGGVLTAGQRHFLGHFLPCTLRTT